MAKPTPALEQRIPEGENVFVLPYLPVIDYLLKTRNPTSYSWLQPGMMSHEDEAIVLHRTRSRAARIRPVAILSRCACFQRLAEQATGPHRGFSLD